MTVLRWNDYTKKGHGSKLESVWTGPLLITEVITPVLFRGRSKKKQSVLHYDSLKRNYLVAEKSQTQVGELCRGVCI